MEADGHGGGAERPQRLPVYLNAYAAPTTSSGIPMAAGTVARFGRMSNRSATPVLASQFLAATTKNAMNTASVASMVTSQAHCGISQSGSANAPPRVIGSTTNIAVIVVTNHNGHGVADSAATDARMWPVSARAARGGDATSGGE